LGQEGSLMVEPLSRRAWHSLASLALLTLALIVFWFTYPVTATQADAADKPLEAQHGIVVSVSAAGSEVGLSILTTGGTAVDGAGASPFRQAALERAAAAGGEACRGRLCPERDPGFLAKLDRRQLQRLLRVAPGVRQEQGLGRLAGRGPSGAAGPGQNTTTACRARTGRILP